MPWATHNVEGSKTLYDDVIDRREDLFPHHYVLFQVAAAIGLRNDERREITERHRGGDADTRIFSSATTAFDQYGVFYAILTAEHPTKSEKERLEILEEHAEYGIHIIHDQLTTTGTIDLDSYV